MKSFYIEQSRGELPRHGRSRQPILVFLSSAGQLIRKHLGNGSGLWECRFSREEPYRVPESHCWRVRVKRESGPCHSFVLARYFIGQAELCAVGFERATGIHIKPGHAKVFHFIARRVG